MRRLFLILLMISNFALAKEWKADDILGIWWTPEKDGRIEIYKENDKYFGKIIWLIPENRGNKDDKNPDPDKRKKIQ